MITHEEASDLLAAFALDAVDGDEFEGIEDHLRVCPRCRAEVDAYREVAAALGHTVEPLPRHLWPAISLRVGAHDVNAGPTVHAPARGRTTERSGASAPRSRARGTSRRRVVGVVSVAVGAAAVATLLGLSLAQANNRRAQLQGAIGEVAHTEVVAAEETPGHRNVNLVDSGHRLLAQFVFLPNGRGYLVTSTLPALSSQKTYQLWGVVKGRTISLGLLGRAPHSATFTLADTAPPFRLGVTVEVARGARQPSGPMLASGVV